MDDMPAVNDMRDGNEATWLHGVYVPVITPLAENGEVALDALERLAGELLTDGADGLVALGTTAEVAVLSAAERQAVTAALARVCREHGAPLIVGAGGNDTAASREALAALGGVPEVRASLTLVPPFTRPSEAGVLAHFRELAAAAPVPLIVYHVPYRTGRPLSADTLRRLAELPNVIGVKYAAGGIDPDTMALLADPPPGFAIMAGDDLYLSPLLALGTRGGVLASAHLATARFAELVRHWHADDAARARPLGHRLAALSATLFAEPNPAVVKAVLHAQGRIPTPDVRLPLLPAAPESVSAALKALHRLNPPVED